MSAIHPKADIQGALGMSGKGHKRTLLVGLTDWFE
jgi:hypothetical protein